MQIQIKQKSTRLTRKTAAVMLYAETENTVTSMYRYWPPHTHNHILHTYGFHVSIKKKKNQDREKGIKIFAAYRNEANIEGDPAQTRV